MSSKSDRDNRSNQLNPNNSAYSSSRGLGRDYDDDLEWEQCESPIRGLDSAAVPALTFHKQERIKIHREFTFDLMSMSGVKAHLKATVEFTNKFSSEPKYTDVIEKKLQLRLREVFERETNSPIALILVRDAKGREMEWLGEEYQPRQISRKLAPEEQQRIRQLNELWSQSVKSKVQEFKKTLKDHKSIPREDLGFIVTHDSFDSPVE
ncbi:hypothetical protein [Limnobacter sp.]|uniref:hypothetical protein n=1 Tax=Limnobacter sp. TaxID=2003368 RepID=UPI003BAC71B5